MLLCLRALCFCRSRIASCGRSAPCGRLTARAPCGWKWCGCRAARRRVIRQPNIQIRKAESAGRNRRRTRRWELARCRGCCALRRPRIKDFAEPVQKVCLQPSIRGQRPIAGSRRVRVRVPRRDLRRHPHQCSRAAPRAHLDRAVVEPIAVSLQRLVRRPHKAVQRRKLSSSRRTDLSQRFLDCLLGMSIRAFRCQPLRSSRGSCANQEDERRRPPNTARSRKSPHGRGFTWSRFTHPRRPTEVSTPYQ